MKKIFFLIFMVALVVNAQKTGLINSGELLEDGISLHDKGLYKDAIKKYDLIDRNDTNYIWALYEKSLTYNAMEEYEKSKDICLEGLKFNSDYTIDFYSALGTAYDELDQKDKAIEIYQKALKKAPHNYLLNFNVALTYFRLENLDSAIVYAKKAIDCNFMHASSHYLLGMIYAERQMYAQAMMPLQIFLLLEASSSRSEIALSTLVSTTQINESNSDKKFNISNEDKVFDNLNKIIKSKVALNDKYKTPVKKVKDPLIKQLYILIEKLETSNDMSNFWHRNYTSYFKDIYKEDYFLPHVYLIISGLNVKSLQKEIKKASPQIEKYTKWAIAKIQKIMNNRFFYFNGKYQSISAWYQKRNIESLGNIKNEKMNIGPWEFFYSNGVLFAKGYYNDNGEKTGKWCFYYPSGQLKNEMTYDKDNITTLIQYYEDGTLKGDTRVTGGPNDFNIKYYYQSGLPSYEENYKNDQKNGPASYYFDSGEKRSDVEYKDDKEINYTDYFKSGKIRVKYTPKENGLFDYIGYYDNGNISASGVFNSDKRNGKWNWYFEDGKTKRTENYDEDGDIKDTSFEFHPNGKLSEVGVYKKNGKNGIFICYDDDGTIHYESVYKNNEAVSVKFYDKTGSVISTSEKKLDKMEIKFIYPTGELYYTGFYKNGKKEGTWQYYYRNGNLKLEENYKNDKQNGPIKEYYENGSLNREFNMEDDKANGYYTSYFSSGKIKSEGWYVDDKMEGYWYDYFKNGGINRIGYYLKDELSGFQQEFNYGGKLAFETYYKDNLIRKYISYDTIGNVIDTFVLKNGNYAMKIVNDDKKIKEEFSFLNGYISGPYITYHCNGQISSLVEYKDNKLHGQVKYYDYKGNLEFECNYINGKKEGTSKWYKNNKLEIIGDCKNGENVGIWKTYSETGKLIETNEYDNFGNLLLKTVYAESGELIIMKKFDKDYFYAYTYYDKNNNLVPDIPVAKENGKVIAYFPNGNKSIEQEYKTGTLAGISIEYYPNGNKYKETPFKNFYDVDGVKKTFWPNGKVKSEITYVNDDINGESKFYRQDGTLEHTEMYYANLLHGLVIYYDAKGNAVKKEKFVYDIFYE